MMSSVSVTCRCGMKSLSQAKLAMPQVWRRTIFHKSQFTRKFSTSSSSHSNISQTFYNYWNSLKWFSIPASVGFACIGYIQFRHILKRERQPVVVEEDQQVEPMAEWQVNFIKSLPTRFLSRCFGMIMSKEVPESLRVSLYGFYSKLFGCNLEEALIQDLNEFKSFQEFFTRELKAGARSINSESCLVSPVDGKVLHFGKMDSGSMMIEQVKGFDYPLQLFVGPRHPFTASVRPLLQKRGGDTDEKCDDHCIYYCNIYLAPGDYHWFHSPCDWDVEGRRHIPGMLWSVSPHAARTIQGLFNMNERVVMSGRWKHGSLLMAAVGAYNVGSINLHFPIEKGFETNSPFALAGYSDRLYGSQGLHVERGDPVGYFSLGSTIILVFTAPRNFKFSVQPGQQLKLGQALGSSMLSQGQDGA